MEKAIKFSIENKQFVKALKTATRVMRQKNLPDNVKVRLCDMRVAFIESREFLDKVMKDESNNNI